MRPAALILAFSLVGCTATPTQLSGDSFMYSHGDLATTRIINSAAKVCAGRGKELNHLGTDCAAVRCVSKFRCE